MKRNKSLSSTSVTKLSAKVVRLGQLAMQFAQTKRVTQLPSGDLESDTDHTFMLSLIACALAASYDKKLDVGKIAQYALVHDLVEAYAGDTSTANISRAQLDAKISRESQALKLIKSNFGRDFPWIHQTIEAYEKLADAEARFVKVLDKAMPAITHLFNDAAYLRHIGVNNSKVRQVAMALQAERLKEYAYDQPLALAIREALEADVSKLIKE